jgi:hypothetical protein
MSTKRNTFMNGPARPYHPQAPDIETAKHLRNMCALYVRGRALASDVLMAVEEFRSSLRDPKAKARQG